MMGYDTRTGGFPELMCCVQETARQMEQQLCDGQSAYARLSETHDRLEQEKWQVQRSVV